MGMNLSTLIEICREGDLADNVWQEQDDENLDAHPDRIEHDIVEQYELVDTQSIFTGDVSYSDGVDNIFIIKNIPTGELYQIKTSHDSWSDDLVESFSSAKITKVKPVTVEVIQYEETGKSDLDRL